MPVGPTGGDTPQAFASRGKKSEIIAPTKTTLKA
jgi:hypothetical protein